MPGRTQRMVTFFGLSTPMLKCQRDVWMRLHESWKSRTLWVATSGFVCAASPTRGSDARDCEALFVFLLDGKEEMMKITKPIVALLLAGALAAFGQEGTGQEIKQGAKKAGEKIKEGAETVAEKTKETAETVAKKTKETVEGAGEKTKETARTTHRKSRKTSRKANAQTTGEQSPSQKSTTASPVPSVH